jgi:hypothetical protein
MNVNLYDMDAVSIGCRYWQNCEGQFAQGQVRDLLHNAKGSLLLISASSRVFHSLPAVTRKTTLRDQLLGTGSSVSR